MWLVYCLGQSSFIFSLLLKAGEEQQEQGSISKNLPPVQSLIQYLLASELCRVFTSGYIQVLLTFWFIFYAQRKSNTNISSYAWDKTSIEEIISTANGLDMRWNSWSTWHSNTYIHMYICIYTYVICNTYYSNTYTQIIQSWGEELPISINSSTNSTPLLLVHDLASYGSEGSLQVSQEFQSFQNRK